MRLDGNTRERDVCDLGNDVHSAAVAHAYGNAVELRNWHSVVVCNADTISVRDNDSIELAHGDAVQLADRDGIVVGDCDSIELAHGDAVQLADRDTVVVGDCDSVELANFVGIAHAVAMRDGHAAVLVDGPRIRRT